MRDLNREEWRALCEEMEAKGPEAFRAEATLRRDSASVEFRDGDDMVVSRTNVHVSEGATDIRLGEVQLLLGATKGALIQSHPPYPISRWTVLWEGEL